VTRLLTFSDIHGKVPAVDALLEAERPDFDAVVVAGDIGPHANEFFYALEPFGCPVLYVYGNWDHALAYDHVFNERFTHLHGATVHAGDLEFVGVSGCETHWGQNPIWRELCADVEQAHRPILERLANAKTTAQKDMVRKTHAFELYEAAYRTAQRETSVRSRSEAIERVRSANCDPNRVVIVSHERLYHLPDQCRELGAHLFGHRHGFKVTKQGSTIFVNVSALDPWAKSQAQYGIIEWTSASGFRVLEKYLPHTDDLRRRCIEYDGSWKEREGPER
jgi:Icc-related predicted phosphoesterase